MRLYSSKSIFLFDYIKCDLTKDGVFNTILNKDVGMYVNVLKLKETTIPEFKNSYKKIEEFFKNIYILLKECVDENSYIYKQAYKKFYFPEVNEVCLGFAEGKYGGGWGEKTRRTVLNNCLEIIKAGCNEPIIFELVELFTNDVGADRISDMICNIIREDFIKFTKRVIKNNHIDLSPFELTSDGLIKKPNSNYGVFFVPSELISDIPIAHSWEEVQNILAKNEIIKNHINKVIKDSWKLVSMEERKLTIKKDIFLNLPVLQTALNAFKNEKQKDYNPEENDTYYVQKKINPVYEYLDSISLDNLSLFSSKDVALYCIDRFKQFIELNGGRNLIKDAVSSKKEKTAQGILFAVAGTICNVVNCTMSRESNNGRGMEDFLFSIGKDKTLVEIKLSSNTDLIHGYTTQIEEYAKSEETKNRIFLVVVNESNNSLNELKSINESDQAKKNNPPDLILVESFPIDSASKYKKLKE